MERLLSRTEAAAMLGVKPQTLSCWKSAKRYDLPVLKVGHLVKYRESDLVTWLESRTENATTTDQN